MLCLTMDPTIVNLFGSLPQQGPGSDACSLRALSLVPTISRAWDVLDVGCGTGRQTLMLLAHTAARVTAVDIRKPYLEVLMSTSESAGLASRLEVIQASMRALPFGKACFDLIWAEGSAYIMGFEDALASWKPLLQRGGSIALTDLTWFTSSPPSESRAYFEGKYPDMTTVAQRVRVIERNGFRVLGQFPIPAEAWWRGYYHPLEKAIEKLEEADDACRQHVEFLSECRAEIDMFRRHSETYGYTFFVMDRPEAGN